MNPLNLPELIKMAQDVGQLVMALQPLMHAVGSLGTDVALKGLKQVVGLDAKLDRMQAGLDELGLQVANKFHAMDTRLIILEAWKAKVEGGPAAAPAPSQH